MGSYNVRFRPSVEKDLRKLPAAIVARVLERIDLLTFQPFPGGCGKLTSTERLYRLRVRDYRIIYEVDSAERLITVHYVRHRREVYRGL